MKCPACSGNIAGLKMNDSARARLDQLGVCRSCGGIFLRDLTYIFAKTWCKCPNTSGQENYFFKDNGDHGWLHTVCGQITQTG